MVGPVHRIDLQGKKVTRFARLGQLAPGRGICYILDNQAQLRKVQTQAILVVRLAILFVWLEH